MSDATQYLSEFFGTQEKEASKISHLFTAERLMKDEFHTREGQYNASLSFIKSGILRIYRIHEGTEITQYLSTSGEIATELGSFLFDQPTRWHIQAISEVELFTISNANYQSIAQIIPDWNQFERLFFAKCFMFLEDRVHSFLSMTAEQRYDFLALHKPALFIQAPQQHIASMLGITPETFSRIRRKKLS